MPDKVPWFLDGMFVRMADYEKIKLELEETKLQLDTMTKAARAFELRLQTNTSELQFMRAQVEAFEEAAANYPPEPKWLYRMMANRRRGA